MRKIANVPKVNVNEIVRVMIYELGDGTGAYLFLYMSARDGPCDFDEFYEKVAEAEQFCDREFGINHSMWQIIEEPHAGCQHDWIARMKVEHDGEGNPLWGQFEPATD
jgi:hypothetical protein